MKRRGVLAAGLVMLVLSAAWARSLQDRFPHQDHEGVFPVCTGCHEGILSGVAADNYPDSAECVECHDGVTEERVEWARPEVKPSNIVFDHTGHTEATTQAGDTATCLTCHRLEGVEGIMAAGRAVPERCITCHAHEAPEHLAEAADCRLCHLPIAQATSLFLARIEAFPKPAAHDTEQFVGQHEPTSPEAEASCAVCHAQESCTRCHLNGPSVALIANLPRDARIAEYTRGLAAEYPLPSDHKRTDWRFTHPEAAEVEVGRCANCHAQPSCRTCHLEAEVTEIAALPHPIADGAPGVFQSEALAVHPVGFTGTHGAEAAASEQTCWSCHADQVFCVDCHEGPSEARFHVGNFRERHGVLAYGGEQDCSSCHSTEAFCRACHAGIGFASDGRADFAFHNAKPFWLLGHGRAARQGLATCASCHAQTDCAQCHSAVGAWRINPHGPEFDGSRVQERNQFTCLQCHREPPE